LEIAKKTKEICHKHGIPIIINDRIDIALAMGADGVHLGQNDMPPEVARQLLPDGTIIGVSVSTVEEAKKVASDNIANYVGIAAVWPTNSKQVKTHPLRPRGVGPILDALAPTNINSVAIGMP
jgi:thiamine-phosphate diphosphorylase / hydroxyethylthiazole kinase